jgi:class 3 adenylate cyclase
MATAPPAQVLAFLQAYDAVVGPTIAQWEGTVEQVTEARVRVVFNAPLPCEDPATRAVHMALALREALAPVCAHWRTEQYAFTLGIGIAQGDATVGVWRRVGRLDYAVLGPVTAVATALSDAAADGQILLTPAVATAVAGRVATKPVVLCGHPGDVPLGRVMQVCEGRGQ